MTGPDGLFVARRGEGPAVLLLHGQPGVHEHLFPVADLLVRDHLVLSPDRPGYGRSALGPMGVAEQAALFAELIASASAGPAVVVAHSYAGAIALTLADRRPDLVSGLVLAASVGGAGSVELPDRLLAAPVVGRLGCDLSLLLYGTLGPLAGRLPGLYEAARDMPTTSTLALLEWRESFAFEQRELVRVAASLEEAARRVEQPAAVLQGSVDKVVLPAAGRDLADRLPAGWLVELEGQGHLLPRDAPAALAQAVRAVELLA